MKSGETKQKQNIVAGCYHIHITVFKKQKEK